MNWHLGRKPLEYYKGLLVKADLGLHEQIAECVQSRAPAGATVLDLGAGEGALSARLRDMGYRVTAADKDAENFKVSDVAFSPINFDSREAMDHFVAAHVNTFDVVLGVEVIEHVEDQWRYVRQLLAMAKPGGFLLVTTPNTTSWLSRITFLLTGRFHQFADADLSYGHINPISPWELRLVMEGVGVRDLSITPAGTLPAIYLTGSGKLFFMNFLALLFRPFSKGLLDGWCVMAVGRKPS